MSNSNNHFTPSLADNIREKTSCITALNHSITNLLEQMDVDDESGIKQNKTDIYYLLILSENECNEIDQLLKKKV
jgi:hypothetical protein